ncbi:MAG: hypothetical protein K6T66_06500 [Peptococcaceae bacterium]|nr:hypothetical protein [Peptococcaceae bacterium]
MPLYAFKNGQTVLDETTMNSLLSLQDFYLIYEGTQRDAKTGSGTAEFDCASYDHAIRFTATGTTEVARVEFELVKHGAGADLVVELRSGFNPSGTDGTLLKSMTLPKEFIPTGRSYWSIPIALEGLTSGSQYWLIVRGNGDANNHFHLHGETSQDANYPCYYRARGGSGAWTAENAIHFKVFSGVGVTSIPYHEIAGGNACLTYEYTIDTNTWLRYLSAIYLYIPAADGSSGIRQKLSLTRSGNVVLKGVAS